MSVESNNVDYILAFVRNVDREMRDSEKHARRLAQTMEGLVLERIARGEFLSGMMSGKPYSTNPIKAYKLGNAVVSGQGMSKQLTINGIVIDNQDWYWGSWDAKKKGVDTSRARSASFNFGDFTPRPVPVFIPGYRTWRVEYNSLSETVDLDFTGNMLDNFNVDYFKEKGSNQYGGRYSFDFNVLEPFRDQGEIVDYYRQFLAVTEGELESAANEVGSSLIDIIMSA